MSETPTKAPAKFGGFNLPVLPDGWSYDIRLTGPGSQSINVHAEHSGGPLFVDVRTGLTDDTRPRSFEADSLAEGVKQAVAITKTLRELAAHEEKTLTARTALLAQIGNPDAEPLTRQAGATSNAPSGVNVESRGGKGVQLGDPTADEQP